MAYTIISQNNTTTTLADENGNVITVPARVTLATSTDYTITKVNNNSVDLEDGDGKVIRGVPACVVLAGSGGGGSVDKNKIINKATSLPAASASNAGQAYMYDGADTEDYTHGYIYQSQPTYTDPSATISQTVGSGLTDLSVDVNQFVEAEQPSGSETVSFVASGTTPTVELYNQTPGDWSVSVNPAVFIPQFENETGLTLADIAADDECYLEYYTKAGWILVHPNGQTDADPVEDWGFDISGDLVAGLQVFIRGIPGSQEWSKNGTTVDLADYGISYNGTPANGDTLTVAYTAASISGYAWTRVDVQPTGVSSVNGQTGDVTLTASDVGALPTSGGTITGQVVLAPTASIVPTHANQALGSDSKPFGTVYAGSFSEGGGSGTWYIPIGDRNTMGVIIGAVYSMPAPSADLDSVPLLNLGATDSNYTHGYIYECVTDDNTTWYWKQLDVQPSGTANKATGNYSTGIGENTSGGAVSVTAAFATGIGPDVHVSGDSGVAIGALSGAGGNSGLALGPGAQANAAHSIQLSSWERGSWAVNNTPNTLKVHNGNGNFMLMDASGNLPADRLASTANLADGNYRLRLVMASGVPTLEWVAE